MPRSILLRIRNLCVVCGLRFRCGPCTGMSLGVNLLWGVKSFAKRASPRLSLLLPLHLRSNATDTTTMEIPYKFDESVPLMFAIHI
jgi:hypothetical protein